jgi:hypothetical protein
MEERSGDTGSFAENKRLGIGTWHPIYILTLLDKDRI